MDGGAVSSEHDFGPDEPPCSCEACRAADEAEDRRAAMRHGAIHVWYEMSALICQNMAQTRGELNELAQLHTEVLKALDVSGDEIRAVLNCAKAQR